MNRIGHVVLVTSLALSCLAPASGAAEPNAPAPLRMVPFHAVRLDDPVWRPRVKQLVRDTLPHAFKNTEQALDELRMCAEFIESGGKTRKPPPHRFRASDLFKVMEGA